MRLLKKCLLLIVLCSANLATFAQKTAVYDVSISYRTGLELFDKEKYSAAAEQFRQVENSDPATSTGPVSMDELINLKINSQYYSAVCAAELFNSDAEFLLVRFTELYPEHPQIYHAYFYLGKLYYRMHRYIEAADWFTLTDTNNLNSKESLEFTFKSGYCYFIAGNYDAAERSFQSIKGGQTKYAYPSTYYLAYIQYLLEKYPEALENFLLLRDSKVYASVCPYYISEIYFRQEKYDELFAFAIPIVRGSNPINSSEIYRLIASAYFKRSQYSESIVYYKELMQKDSNLNLGNVDVYQIGYSYYKTAEFDKAIPYFERLSDGEDNFAQTATYTIADCFLKKGNKQSAMNSFYKASRMTANAQLQEDAFFNYAKLCYELDIHQTALSAFKEFIKTYPKSANIDNAKELLGELLINTRNFKDALEILESIADKKGNVLLAYQKVTYYRGVELYNDAKIDEAIKLFDKAIAFSPDKQLKALANYWKAEGYYDQGNYTAAITNYQEFTNNPFAAGTDVFERSYYGLAYCYFNKENYTLAAYYFEKYVNNAKEKKIRNDATFRLADCAFVIKDYEKALINYSTIINEKLPGADYAIYQKGMIMGIKNQLNDKIKVLENISADYPASSYSDDAAFEIAYSYFLLGNLQESRTRFDEFSSTFPNSSYLSKALLNTGLIYYTLEEDNNAITAYKQVVELFPSSQEAKEALLSIKNIYIEAGNANAFIDYTNSIPSASYSLSSQDSLSYKAANTRYLKGDCENGILSFDQYLEKFPEGYFSRESHYYRAECLIRAGREQEALKDYLYIIEKGNNKFTENSLLIASKILIAGNKYEEAIPLLQQLESNAEFKTNYGYAIVQLMNASMYLSKIDSTLMYASKVLNYEKASSEELNTAHLYAGKCHLAKQDTNAALTEFIIVVNTTKTISGAEAKHLIATIQYWKGDLDNSEKTCFDLINQIPSYEYWVGKAFILVGDNYLKRGDAFQAQNTWQSLLDNYEQENDGVKQMAREKIEALAEMEPEKLPVDNE